MVVRIHPGQLIVFLLLFLCLPGSQAAALQEDSLQEDSLQAERDARDAQARFERLRRQEAPMTWAAGGAGPCDERVGRMCLRHGGPDRPVPPEPPAIAAGRERLLQELSAAAAIAPSHRWIQGQQLAYLGEAGQWDRALEVASRGCGPGEPGASDVGCPMMLGYVLHGSGQYPEAMAAFQEALARMNRRELGSARAWEDPGVLMDHAGYRLHRTLPDSVRWGWEALFWRLSDPLWMSEGNPRWTEHMARHALATFRANARNGYGLSWGSDLEELLLRYGAEAGWERARPRMGDASLAELIGRHPQGSRSFVPPGSWLEEVLSPISAAPGESPSSSATGFLDPSQQLPEWLLRPPRPREGFEVPYVTDWGRGRGQWARFRRGEETLLVVVPALLPPESDEGLPGLGSGEGALGHDTPESVGSPRASSGLRPPVGFPPDGFTQALLAFPLEPMGGASGVYPTTPTRGADRQGVSPDDLPGGMRIVLPPGWHAVSMETVDSQLSRAWRERAVISAHLPPEGEWGISDLLLVDAGIWEEGVLEDAAGAGRPSGRLRPGEAVGVVFEVYGLPAEGARLNLRLSMSREDRGILRRAGEWLGLVSPRTPVQVSWSQPEDTGGTRFLGVDITPGEMEPGTYELMVEAEAEGRSAVVARRWVEMGEGEDF
ncbi:MAG: hypothetical protein WEA09_02010 [Gemmatimonadota bacterium]